MLSWLLSWLVLSGSIALTAAFVPGFEVRGGWRAVVVVAALFGALSWLLGKVLFVLIGISTLGLGFLFAFLTRWLVMALLLKLTDALSDSLTIRSFKSAVIAALAMSALGTVGQWLVDRLI
jgi:putative membrane protein